MTRRLLRGRFAQDRSCAPGTGSDETPSHRHQRKRQPADCRSEESRVTARFRTRRERAHDVSAVRPLRIPLSDFPLRLSPRILSASNASAAGKGRVRSAIGTPISMTILRRFAAIFDVDHEAHGCTAAFRTPARDQCSLQRIHGRRHEQRGLAKHCSTISDVARFRCLIFISHLLLTGATCKRVKRSNNAQIFSVGFYRCCACVLFGRSHATAWKRRRHLVTND